MIKLQSVADEIGNFKDYQRIGLGIRRAVYKQFFAQLYKI